MTKDLSKALETVEVTYTQIREMADSMLYDAFKPTNDLISLLETNLNNLSIEALRHYMLELQLNAFSLSELRDKTATKAACAEATKKEAYATSYITQDGTAGTKDANTTIAVSENIVVDCLYQLVAALCKTKVDQVHRLIDVIKTVLMGKMQELKLNATIMTD